MCPCQHNNLRIKWHPIPQATRGICLFWQYLYGNNGLCPKSVLIYAIWAPMATAAHTLHKPSVPILCNKHKPLEVVTAWCKSSIISIKQIASSNSTYQTTETCTRAPVTLQWSGDVAPSGYLVPRMPSCGCFASSPPAIVSLPSPWEWTVI